MKSFLKKILIMKAVIQFLLFVFSLTLLSLPSYSWSKRGHALVSSSAAYILSEKAPYLKNHAFDLEFYSNVPDIVWKSTKEVYAQEYHQHFLDMEIFERQMSKEALKANNNLWPEKRADFFKTHKVEKLAGRVLWRIQEMNQKLTEVSQKLRSDEIKDRQILQGQWLILAGTLSHYVADLAMPLHTTENYDGQASKQRGIHAFFEDTLVDELYPKIAPQILTKAQKEWPQFHEKKKNLSPFELALELARDSHTKMPQLLALDKKTDRKNIKKASEVFADLIESQLVQGTLYLAEVWSRQLEWKYDGEKFYFFDGKPEYILPEKE